jgi:hypothetical protein
MVKQDAMNVFLGFYIPQEMTVPLWDLDSDYYLHNRSYRPPTPHVNRILFDEHRLSRNNAGASSRDFMLLGEMEGTERERERDGSSRVMQEEVARKYFINTPAMQNQGVLMIGDSEAKGSLGFTEGRENKEKEKEKEREKEDAAAQGDGLNGGCGKHLAMQRLLVDRNSYIFNLFYRHIHLPPSVPHPLPFPARSEVRLCVGCDRAVRAEEVQGAGSGEGGRRGLPDVVERGSV